MESRVRADDTETLLASLPPLPEPAARPVFVVVVGLPGTGKSYLSQRLAARIPVVILETDRLRKALWPAPTYTATESARLFRACHQLVERLLVRGASVLLDATNLVEAHRERLYHIAERLNCKLVLVRVEAPDHVVRERLERRAAGDFSADASDADWRVYQRMRASVEPIARNHFVVDTSRDITPVVEKILREVRRWQRRVR
ncbi:MAG: ATP-binding protein [Chloroflexi bacterium]|nr:ATP-binding protein [Chloroflexota bacterium]